MRIFRISVLTIAVIGNLFLFHGIANAQSDESIFWTGSDGSGVAKIQRANLNGNSPSVFFAGDQQDPEGVIVDPIRSIVYWVDGNISRIRRAGLDGVVLSDVAEVGDTFGLAIDPIKRFLYWSNATRGVIVRANLDLTDQIDIISGLPLNAPQGLALDRKSNRIYWVDFSGGKIMSADLSEPTNHTVVRSGLVGPIDLALDLGKQHLYWGERGRGAIRRGNINSSSNDIDLITGIQPSGIALDVKGDALYWTDSVVDEVNRVNLDGSGKTLISSTVDPFGITVFRRTYPLSLLQELVNDVLALNLSRGISNSLDAKLDTALKVLDDVNENNDIAAINNLYAFINAVLAQSGNAIDNDSAKALILLTEAIIDTLSN